MSLISSVANYGGRQPTNTSYIKQFVQSSTSLMEWIFVTTGATTYIEPSITNKTILIPQNMIVESDLTVNGIFYNPSDERLKNGITTLGDADLVPVLRLRPVKYFFNHDTNPNGPTQRYGLIAQEVEELFPELVSKPVSEEEMKAVNYIELVPLLLAQIQKMQNEIDSLTERLNNL